MVGFFFVKPLATILILISAILPAFCQTQEKGLMERMDNPNMSLGNGMQNKKFVSSGSLKIKQYSESADTFGATREASLGAYAFTRTFLGIKNPWLGPKTFDAKKASLYTRSFLPNLERQMPVKKAIATTFDPRKDTPILGNPVVQTREYRGDGVAQGAVSRISDKITADMTIDQVRELLNKPR